MANPLESIARGLKILKEKTLDPAPTGPEKISKESKEAAKAVKKEKK